MNNAATPILFRASLAQRTMAFLIFAGSWLSGVRALSDILHRLPDIHFALKAAEASHEPTTLLWTLLVLSLLGVLLAGGLLAGSLLFLLLVEGTQIALDAVGLAVEIHTLPAPLARRLGAGRLAWKRIRHVERRLFFFTLEGGGEGAPKEGELEDTDLRFLVVDEMERLVLTILERSPNIRLED
ncbi:MAG TPA: hypothetical protein VJ483_07365 [Holophagaceae bacterium]|nr:hypothetical protein [Holophagaceae bacterium]